jgi:ribosomal protein S18 acetylase RimI-like enzyme
MFMNSLWAVAKSPKRSGLEVVAGSKEHEAAIMEIVDAVWGPVVTENERLTGGIYGLCYPDPLGRKKEAIRKRLVENPQGLCTVLERGRPIGFCLLDMDVPKSYGTISQLGVLPSARRHGAATALCMEAFRIFRERGLRHVRFMVGPGENTEATRWLCSSIGLHREIPTVGLFGPL